ncbi:MAG: 50S ribosomal protein L24 [Chloroflexi bacterium]|nr:50S ribosomal protein L24 [Chloroflexota bacterium]|tara:strand:+ start:532 stop:846 length:315 start_codon:yes stop_codon:yes gene_type:complete
MRKIKTNDNVIVIKGKDAGKKGKVQKILPDKGKLLIEGINIYKKHMKTQSETQPGGIIDREMFVNISNVKLIDPNTNEPTKVKINQLKDNTRVRANKITGEVIE